jgi:predicted acetyltransferase
VSKKAKGAELLTSFGHMFLTRPTAKYKDSFLKALDEYQREGRYLEYDKKELEKNFEEFCLRFKEKERGINLDPELVPETTFWLIDDAGEFVGRVSIRHYLNERLRETGGHIGYDIRPSFRKLGYGRKILALALPEAKELGITRALLTCDSTNIGSRKIITENGGVLVDELSRGEGKSSKLRFWIDIEKD